MRFLPIFLDLRSGPVALVGGGDLVRAKLRLLLAAGANVRWYATDGKRDVTGIDAADAARIEHAHGDPLTADLSGVIAVLCAGAGETGPAMSVRAKPLGLPVNVMDDLAHSTFIFPAIVDRGDVVVAIGTGGASPVVARRVRERIEAALPARIGDLARFIGGFRKTIHGRIADMVPELLAHELIAYYSILGIKIRTIYTNEISYPFAPPLHAIGRFDQLPAGEQDIYICIFHHE